MEFAARNIPFRAQPSLALEYKGVRLKQTYVADSVCFDSILIELKASSGLVGEHDRVVVLDCHENHERTRKGRASGSERSCPAALGQIAPAAQRAELFVSFRVFRGQ
jgi:hypothetical protein